MKTKHFFLIGFFLLSSILFSKDLEWNIYSYYAKQVFPSLAWSQSYMSPDLIDEPYFYGDDAGQFGIIASGINPGDEIKIIIEENEIMERTTLVYKPDKATNEVIFLFPQILYKWNALQNWRQPKPLNIKVSVYLNGKLDTTKTDIFLAQSINDCPFYLISNFNFVSDLKAAFVSYVNENHPIITKAILPEILKEGVIKQIDGYRSTSKNNYKSVYQQVYAVWHYFNKNNFYYSSLSNTYQNESAPYVVSQYVRTFSDIYKTKQANCVDGTILMASILTRMGISSYLVTAPGHCFLAFSVDGTDENLEFIETTLLGNKSEALSEDLVTKIRSVNLTGYDAEIRSEITDQSTFDMFVFALAYGKNNYEEGKNYFKWNQGEVEFYENEKEIYTFIKNNSYGIFSIDYYREAGLLPLNL
ncbi:MAG: hypothetical protein RBT46_01465 [Weeksellaceae bacterium]|jgi:hypothetical protein|nr:hypothetical protein [Weeksellaceae bacterium]